MGVVANNMNLNKDLHALFYFQLHVEVCTLPSLILNKTKIANLFMVELNGKHFPDVF